MHVCERVRACADRVNGTTDQFLVWCDLNDESDLLRRLIQHAIEVKGSDKDEHRKDAMMGFAEGRLVRSTLRSVLSVYETVIFFSV